MKELFALLPTVSGSGHTFIDTCFFLWLLEHDALHKLEKVSDPVFCSFTCDELVLVEHRISEKKSELRHYLKNCSLSRFVIPVHPGDVLGEKSFVASIEPRLLELVADPSDAVLAAAALQTRSHILTRDKHHLFTSALDNFFHERGISVSNKI
ncbi:MAG: PIN domain-containing protein [Candidatus Woesearchaeota archaeon]|nr:MAG: PIN domain-containing protein [Candidatus Woesearchaeota archaeon]